MPDASAAGASPSAPAGELGRSVPARAVAAVRWSVACSAGAVGASPPATCPAG
ncbi:MAG: hypothetical protein NVV66_13115 [Cellulomonas sp.]|uniref:hypothetical protein n=1 Tax=Cellulomonas sp. TaxID=40001 RepID=UPI00258EC1F4|nr:hypothetical protein [Cellulomonas sp.]MCR6705580.1 hypothetical protein [Cellulomonas sp.]